MLPAGSKGVANREREDDDAVEELRPVGTSRPSTAAPAPTAWGPMPTGWASAGVGSVATWSCGAAFTAAWPRAGDPLAARSDTSGGGEAGGGGGCACAGVVGGGPAGRAGDYASPPRAAEATVSAPALSWGLCLDPSEGKEGAAYVGEELGEVGGAVEVPEGPALCPALTLVCSVSAAVMASVPSGSGWMDDAAPDPGLPGLTGAR